MDKRKVPFHRVKLSGLNLRLTREEWDEIEIALGAVAVPGVREVYLVRGAAGEVTAVAAKSDGGGD